MKSVPIATHSIPAAPNSWILRDVSKNSSNASQKRSSNYLHERPPQYNRDMPDYIAGLFSTRSIMTIKELQIKKDELEAALADPAILTNPEKLKSLSIDYAKVEKTLALHIRREELASRIREAETLASASDEDMRNLAATELTHLRSELAALEKKLSPTASDLPDNIIMEIRAGAGGDEASLFAQELFTMYSRFSEKMGWRTVLISESKSDLNGYKEVVFEINGEGVYRALRMESGVHRVQRIPDTEKMGRVHTSTASVAVLPKAREIDFEIRPQDIKVEFFRSSGPGGQNVNKVETAVRIYHLPTGLIVVSQDGRSQAANRERATEVLRSRLLSAKLEQEAAKMAAERKSQIGTADRSEKIRTYNFPQDRVTDHRIKESWHNLPSIMEGNIKPIIQALHKAES